MNNQPIVEIRNLKKNYGPKQVLQGINLDITSGQIIGYIGPNGAGKSTTVKILCGLISDFQGEITIFGKDLRKETLEIKKRVGYIPENAVLYESLTPFEFMEFVGEMRGLGTDQTRDKAEKLMNIFEMKPHLNQRIATFSKGMRQKVLICSALLHNPDLIFMDEPLSGLDANSVIMVKEMLIHLAHDGKTIFYSSHLMDVVEKISDRIILIDQGTVIADGSFNELNLLSHDENLEKMFTRLTGNTDHGEKAEAFINAFEKVGAMINLILKLFVPFRWFIEKMGADYDQFIRILKLKLTLDDRRANKYSKKAENAQEKTLIKQSFFQIFMGLFFALFLVMIKTPFTFFYIAHTFLMVIMAMMIISEFSTILFDTSENVIIQPLPIKGNTVSLARNAHVFIYLAMMAFCLSVIPIAIAIYKFGNLAGSIFGFTILGNVLFTLFFANILYLGIMRLVSGERLKNLLMYFQIAIAIFFMAAYQIGFRMIDKTAIQDMVLPVHWFTYLLPPAFFSGLIEAIITLNFDQSHLLFIAEAFILPPAAIYFTGKYLTPVFNRKLMDLEQGDYVSKVKIETKCNSSYYRMMCALMVHTTEEKAAFKMMWKMTGRERQFKQTLFPAFGYMIIMMIVPMIGKHAELSTFNTGYKYLFVLYVFMMVSFALCSSLLIGNSQASAWIFKTVPLASPATFFKGAINAAFARFFVPFYLVVGSVVCAFMGIKVLPDVFIAFLAIYLITLLLYYFQQPGFPFSLEKTAVQGGANVGKVFGLMALAGLAGLLHYSFLKWFPFANLLLIPVYLGAIWYVNTIMVYRKITWEEVDRVNSYT